MANTKITSLDTLATSAVASGDVFPIVDVSDTTQAATGTTKKVDASQILFKNVGGTVTAATTYTATTTYSGTVTANNTVSFTSGALFSGTANFSGTVTMTKIVPPSNANALVTFTNPTSAVPVLDIVSGTSAGLVMRLTDQTTNNTNKFARIAYRHYASSTEEDVLLINATTDSGGNVVNYGGASGVFNAVTQHSFYVGTASNQVTGSEAFRINNNGITAYRALTAGSALTVTGTATVDALRVNQTPTAGTFTNTHYITVNLNGTTYRIACAV